MGCVSSTLLNQEDEFRHIGGNGIGHHIVSLTSTTYGLLTLDPPSPATIPPIPPPRFTLGSLLPEPPEVINSWELMAGLDFTNNNESFRFSPLPPPQPSKSTYPSSDKGKENSSPNNHLAIAAPPSSPLDGFEKLCPPKGENSVVVYTTTLRGVRKTFEACNAVRAAIEGIGVFICERDISMDRGFKEELRELMKGKESFELVPPRVFVKGRYIGGVEEVMKVVEEGNLGKLLQGLPRLKVGHVCEGCGGARFLPCFTCNGSCKVLVMVVKEEEKEAMKKTVVVRCSDCNENGLTICPLCS